jgi:type II secretory ATPase GspE/PulE/Tfp pilus assembly ATPase PilB-like protein
LDKLGFVPDDLEQVRKFCRLPSGLIIANGPTGCGKTTLLYSMLLAMNRDACSVFTVEDPVECALPGVSQIQIRPSVGLNFVRAGRSVLRQDTDVIMIGEIRDGEILNLTVQMALTGHLVLSTLHANTSPGAVQRMLDIGLPPFLVNSGLAAVVSLRLVRTLCPDCKQPGQPPAHSLPPEANEVFASINKPQFFAPNGCDKCRGTGYAGRTAIHEILVMDDAIRQAVVDGAGVAGIRDAALGSGMKTLIHRGLEKAAQGITSVKEVLRVVPHGPNI